MLADRLQAEELPQVNMTAMVDVVLCLLVFFMAATRLYDWDEGQFTVRVPEVGDAAPLTAAPEDLAISVLGPGKVEVGGKPHTLSTLAELLKAEKARYPSRGVLVRGEATLSYQAIADVLAACEAAGIQTIRLPVRPRPDAK